MPSWLSPTKSFWIFKLGVGWVVAFLMTVLYVRGIQLPPDIVTFNAAISACEKSNLWQEAAEAEEMMSDGEISRPVVSNIFYFHPEPWGNDPIWRINIFQKQCECLSHRWTSKKYGIHFFLIESGYCKHQYTTGSTPSMWCDHLQRGHLTQRLKHIDMVRIY